MFNLVKKDGRFEFIETTYGPEGDLPLPTNGDELTFPKGLYSPQTEFDLRKTMDQFADWCEENELDSFPVNEATMVAFFEEHSWWRPTTVSKFATYLSMIHRAYNFPTPKGEHYRLLLKLRRRTCQTPRRQAKALRLHHVLKILYANKLSVYNKALISFMYDTLLRGADLRRVKLKDLTYDLVPTTTAGRHDTDMLLQRGIDLSEGQINLNSRYVYAVKIYKTKTEQLNDVATYRHVAPHTWRLIQQVVLERNLNDDDYLFNINRKSINDALARASKRAHIPIKFTSHSARVGATVDMVAAGVPMAGIMLAGGWKTEQMVAQYGQQVMHEVSGMAALFKDKWHMPVYKNVGVAIEKLDLVGTVYE